MTTMNIPPVSSDSDDLLNSLLADSMQISAAQAEEREMKKRVARGNMPKEELAETVKLLRRWDDAREWRRTHNLVVFTRQLCTSCGTFHQTFEGYFERHKHNRIANTTKAVSVTVFELDLPKDAVYHDSQVPVCHQCAENAGWPLQED